MELIMKEPVPVYSGSYLCDYRIDGKSYHKAMRTISPTNLNADQVKEFISNGLEFGAEIVAIMEFDPSVSLDQLTDVGIIKVQRGKFKGPIYINPDLFPEYMREIMQGNFS